MENIKSSINKITDHISHMKVDSSSIKDDEVNDEIIEWYESRFKVFKEDNCPAAVNAYLQKLMSDESCNTLTRSMILLKAYKYLG